MRGSKAKKLRKAGLKSGPAERDEPTEKQVKEIKKIQAQAKKPYSETRSPSMLYGFADKVKETIAHKRKEPNDSI